MEEDLKNMVQELLSRTIRNDSIAMTVTTGTPDVKHGEPDYFMHYEVDADENIIPVEHDDSDMIPLTNRSVVASVWEAQDDEYRVYRDMTEFKKEYRDDSSAECR